MCEGGVLWFSLNTAACPSAAKRVCPAKLIRSFPCKMYA